MLGICSTIAIRNVRDVGAVKDFTIDIANELNCLGYRNYTTKDSI